MSPPAAAHILALYLWQIALLRPHMVRHAAAWLRLYVLSSTAPPPVLLPQLVHLAALVALFGALGHYNGGDREGLATDDPSVRVRARMSHMRAAPSTARPRPQVPLSHKTSAFSHHVVSTVSSNGLAV